MFVKKDFVENPEFEAFKAEVKEQLSAQKSEIKEIVKNQKSMAAKQEEMSADLKAILTIPSQKQETLGFYVLALLFVAYAFIFFCELPFLITYIYYSRINPHEP